MKKEKKKRPTDHINIKTSTIICLQLLVNLLAPL